MNGISHKQAIQWIDRRLDGLLNESQLLLLDEHLDSCDSCHAYAIDMDGLSAHVQNEFHRRWDTQLGPSQKVFEHVTTKARKIPIKHRFASGMKLVTGFAAVLIFGLLVSLVISQMRDNAIATNGTETSDDVAPVSIPAGSRLLAFTKEMNGNFDIYTIRADGSGLTNLTNNPAHDANPIWSPDGKHIAFESNRNGFMQIYLMDADGSNLIQFTNDKADHGLTMNINGKSNPWSPDGSKLLFLQRSSGGETGNLYMQGVNGENKVLLASGRFSLNNLSWSPDGTYIGYILNESPTPNKTFVTGIYIVDSNGNNSQELKKLIPQNENLGSPYYWSSDGQSIVFIADENDGPGQTVYEFDLETDTLLQKDMLKQGVIDWQDEISLVSERSAFVWQRSDGTSNTLDWDDPNCLLDVTRSLHGNFAIGAYCPDSKKFKLYWANSDGSTIKQLLDSSALIGQLWDIAWSPDDQYIAFNIISDKTSMYIVNIKDALQDSSIPPAQMVIGSGELYTIPTWQPVANNDVVEQRPTPQPTEISSNDNLIAFTSEQNGNSDIYTMRADGGEITNITNNPANDYSPLWSPDGQKIAFITERTGNADIFVMNSDGSGLTQLTDNPGYDGYFSWSPDGQKTIYLTSSGNDPNTNSYQLIVMNADGSNKTALTEEPGSYIFLGWSLSGQKIVYQKQNSENIQNNEIHVIDINRTNHYQWRAIIDEIKWTDEGHFIGHGWSGISEPPSWKIYKFDVNGSDPIEIAIYPSRIVALFNQTYLVEGIRTLAWYSPDGTTSPLKTWDFGTHCTKQGDLFLQETGHTISPDKTRAFVNVHCFDDVTWFYLENTDGSQFVQLTDFSVVGPVIESANWSPDSKYVTMTIASRDGSTADIYLFDIQKMLNDPSTLPVQLTTDGAMKYGAVWQPNP